MDAWRAPLEALWLFLPCYMANMAPVAATRIAPRWNAPLDGGRVYRSRRIIGPHKTWRGLVFGTLAAAATALVQSIAAGGPIAALDFGRSEGVSVLAIGAFGAAIGAFALAGDAAKSFVKRRIGRPGGSSWFPFDQLDFVAGGLIGVVAASPVVAGWSTAAYFGNPWVLVCLVLMTPLLHWLSSILAYGAGLKKVPW